MSSIARWSKAIWLGLGGLVVLGVLCPRVHAASGVERIALLVWHDQGWKSKPADQALRYARRDTRLLASVLKKKGRFKTTVLARPSSARLKQTLRAILLRARRSRKKLHFLFYYSGHADERYLRLGSKSQASGRRFSLKILAHFFKKLRASVKIGILDACNSGALIDLLHARTKGRGRGYAPFFRMPATMSQGMAILTSASPQGKARELDRLNASLFTYHLVQGLWGKADQNRDGRVTSIEAYHYARLKIEQELPGRQQPMYLNHFRGQEDYPITLSYNASLVLAVKPGQRFTLLNDQAVWKLKGRDHHPRVISVMAGSYKLFLQEQNGRCFSQQINVKEKQRRWISADRWTAASCAAGVAKGNAKDPVALQVVERLSAGEKGRLSASFHAGPLTASLFRPFLGAHVGLALKHVRLGFTFLGEQTPLLFVSFVELSVGYGWDLRRYRWHLHLGVLGGIGLLMTHHQDPALRGSSPSLRYGGHAEFSVMLTGRLWLVMRGFLGVSHTIVRGDISGGTFVNAFAGYGTMGMGYRF